MATERSTGAMDAWPATMAVAAAMIIAGTAGCTVIEPCGLGQQEYCTEDGECICGEECEQASDCDRDETCQSYRYNPSHGVCIDEEWLMNNRARLLPGDAGPADDSPDGIGR